MAIDSYTRLPFFPSHDLESTRIILDYVMAMVMRWLCVPALFAANDTSNKLFTTVLTPCSTTYGILNWHLQGTVGLH